MLKPRLPTSATLADKQKEEEEARAPRSVWHVMLNLALAASVLPTRKEYERLHASMTDVVLTHSCVDICVKHFLEQTQSQNPFRYASRFDVVSWVVESHNLVNKRLEKPILTMDQALVQHFKPFPVPEHVFTSAVPWRTLRHVNSFLTGEENLWSTTIIPGAADGVDNIATQMSRPDVSPPLSPPFSSQAHMVDASNFLLGILGVALGIGVTVLGCNLLSKSKRYASSHTSTTLPVPNNKAPKDPLTEAPTLPQ